MGWDGLPTSVLNPQYWLINHCTTRVSSLSDFACPGPCWAHGNTPGPDLCFLQVTYLVYLLFPFSFHGGSGVEGGGAHNTQSLHVFTPRVQTVGSGCRKFIFFQEAQWYLPNTAPLALQSTHMGFSSAFPSLVHGALWGGQANSELISSCHL